MPIQMYFKRIFSALLASATVLGVGGVAVSAAGEVPAAGHYALTGIKEGDDTFDDSIIELLGEEYYLDLNEDGTFSLGLGDEETNTTTGAWDGLNLSIGSETVEMDTDSETSSITIALSDEELMTFTLDDGSEKESSEEDALGDPKIAEDTVVLDDDYVKLTITGITHSEYGYYEISYTAENKTDKSLIVMPDYTFINGLQNIDSQLYIALDPNAESKDIFTIFQGDLIGIDYIGSIGWVFEVLDAESYESLDTGLYGEVKTTLDGLFEQKVDDEGDILLDTDEIKVVYLGTLGIDFSELGLGPDYDDYYKCVYFYIENKSKDTSFYVASDALSYDGQTSDDGFSVAVYKNSKCYVVMPMCGSPENYEVESFADLKEMKISISVDTYDDYLHEYEAFAVSEEVTVDLETEVKTDIVKG